ncbi:MAG: EscU/YscU/HrcU family type III secretion system export apparatus switch protein [Proteobacteria bacterium]|nr:EscU/YscU/HrcU family type III secretion system export apparatus switch protein [Pseudomonadota bacterium]
MTDQEQKPDKQAVALYYDQLTAPKVTAKGAGDLADKIIALALENDVPIREEPELVQLLAKVELGDEIPELLYVAVAEIIAFVYMLKGKVHEQS